MGGTNHFLLSRSGVATVKMIHMAMIPPLASFPPTSTITDSQQFTQEILVPEASNNGKV
jgi:hypothetical protein